MILRMGSLTGNCGKAAYPVGYAQSQMDVSCMTSPPGHLGLVCQCVGLTTDWLGWIKQNTRKACLTGRFIAEEQSRAFSRAYTALLLANCSG